MALTYASWKATIENLITMDAANADWLQIIPSVIDYAEGRCYRDLELMDVTVRNATATFTANQRTFTVPTPASGGYVIVDSINCIISGSRTPLTPVSVNVIDMLWPSSTAPSVSAVPQYFAMETTTGAIIGPPLGASAGTATAEVVGRIQPTPLSDSNTTTILTTDYADLFLAASMIFVTGWQRNFGAQSDDPQQAQSWEGQYMKLLAGASLQEARARFAGPSWTPTRPEPAAQPQRG